MTTATKPTAIPASTVARLIRKELKQAFPATTFSVRSSATGSISIQWIDGATADKVEALVSKYIGFTWDSDIGGWFDERVLDNTASTYYAVSRIDYDRDMSESVRQQVLAKALKRTGAADEAELEALLSARKIRNYSYYAEFAFTNWPQTVPYFLQWEFRRNSIPGATAAA